MNDEQLIWEGYLNNNLLLESLDKIQFYPYEKSFPFFDIYDRSDKDEILHKRPVNEAQDCVAKFSGFLWLGSFFRFHA